MDSPTGRPEPLVVLDVAKFLVAAAVTAGWVNLGTTSEDVIITMVGAALWAVLLVWQRARVTPVSDPVDAGGAPLVVETDAGEAPDDGPHGRHELP